MAAILRRVVAIRRRAATVASRGAQLRAWLIVSIITFACARSRGDSPPVEGRVALGLRTTRTTGSAIDDFLVGDESSSIRVAAEGVVGVRFERFLVGARAGVSTPLHYSATPEANSGEVVPETFSTVYPVDLGLATVVDAGGGVSVSAWFGATVAFVHASSPAQHVDSIAFSGDIPAVSSRDHATSLGFGVAIGYDLMRTAHGRVAALAAFDLQSIGGMPFRVDSGPIGATSAELSCESLTLGVAYAY